MSTNAPVTWLPSESLAAVFDPLSLSDLLKASWVCRTWNATARAHPKFWKDVTLLSCSSVAADFFLARVAASHPETPISLHATFLSPMALDSTSAPAVLRAISSNMHRLVDLSLDPFIFDRASIPVVWDALCRPAPLMEHFTFKGVCGPCLFPVPPNLFSGEAPKLHSLTYTDVLLSNPAPAVYSTVRDITHSFLHDTRHEATLARSHLLMTLFPALEVLKFHAGYLNSALLPSHPTFAVGRLALRSLGIASRVDLIEFLRWEPATQFHILQLWRPSAEPAINDVFLEHLLPCDLYFSASYTSDDCSAIGIAFATKSPDGRQRSFGPTLVSLLSQLPPITSRAVLDAVTVLSVPLVLLQEFCRWLGGSFPAVHTLVLTINDDVATPDFLDDRRVPTPSLSYIVLKARVAAVDVASDVVMHLITKVLLMSERSMTLVLKNVVLEDGELIRGNYQGQGVLNIVYQS